MPGILYVVATPIGNLEDVTLRALRILREVSLIAAEDTRRTAKLLQHYSISTPTTSLHEHNEYARTPHLVRRLAAGESIALVSDAGTPAVSDPGARLVAAAHAEGVAVQPVPGANAAVAALSASGVTSEGFLFAGFPPSRPNARKRWFQTLGDKHRAIVLYEAPHRIRQTLRDVHTELGDRTVALGRELTKAHEQLVVRPISEWLEIPLVERGEFVLVIFPALATGGPVACEVPDSELVASFCQETETGTGSRREALRRVADQFHVPLRRVYAAVEALKNSGK